MRTFKVRLKNPSKRVWNAGTADFITGGGTFDVPDVPFWHRRVLDGTFERVDGEDVPNADTITAQMESDEQPHKTEPMRTKGSKKHRRHEEQQQPSPPHEPKDELFEATQTDEPKVDQDLAVPSSFYGKDGE